MYIWYYTIYFVLGTSETPFGISTQLSNYRLLCLRSLGSAFKAVSCKTFTGIEQNDARTRIQSPVHYPPSNRFIPLNLLYLDNDEHNIELSSLIQWVVEQHVIEKGQLQIECHEMKRLLLAKKLPWFSYHMHANCFSATIACLKGYLLDRISTLDHDQTCRRLALIYGNNYYT